MRRVIAVLLAATVVLGLLSTAGAESPVTIVIDGQVQSLAKPPVIISGTTLVPVRGIFENLGGQVAWDDATQTVTVTSGATRVQLTVGQEGALINGKSITLAVPPQIINGSTMVPLRVISEALGAEVHWQGATHTVDMTTRVGGTLTIVDSDPGSLLPLEYTNAMIDLIYDSLLRYDHRLRLHPSLAKSYAISDDGLTYTFDLQPDVKWHDGTPFTANDVAYTFQTLLHPRYIAWAHLALKGAAGLQDRYDAIDDDADAGRITRDQAISLQRSAWLMWIKSGSIEVVDSDTVRFTLEDPDSSFLTSLADQRILPAHLAPASGPLGLDTSKQALQPVGTGPYKFVSWDQNRELRLVRNPEWRLGVYGTRPRIAEIVFKFMPKETTPYLISTGEADLGLVTTTSAKALEELPNLNVVAYPSLSYTYLGYNLNNALFSDARVRQAITHALDRQRMVDLMLYGYGQVAHSHQMPGRWDYTSDVPQFGYDPIRAAQLLDEAGWNVGPSGIRERNGVPLRFEIATNYNKVREQTAYIIRESLREIGIDVTVSVMEWGSFLDYVDSDQKQAFILGWSMGTDPNSYDIFHSDGMWNTMSGLKNPEIDRLLTEGIATADPAMRMDTYQRFQRVVAQEQIYTWLFHTNRVLVHGQRVQGIVRGRQAAAEPFWEIENWYIDESAK